MRYKVVLTMLMLTFFLYSQSALSSSILSGVKYNQESSSISFQTRLWLLPSTGVDLTASGNSFAESVLFLYRLTEESKGISPYVGAGTGIISLNMKNIFDDLIVAVGVEFDTSFVLPGSKGTISYERHKDRQEYSVAFLVPITLLFSGKNYASDEEVMLLARLISAEARGEPYTGQVAVGAVVVNRVKSQDFPNSIRDVIYQQSQFTPVRDGSINNNPGKSSIEAAQEAISGVDPTNGALYFYNPQIASPEGRIFMSRLTRITTIGNHVFLK